MPLEHFVDQRLKLARRQIPARERLTEIEVACDLKWSNDDAVETCVVDESLCHFERFGVVTDNSRL